ncbi:AI-2E family transporter, partial [Candidatus Microgenomates bacterium]|nr:AI-2E family transporter [Candidatus Microgenomates bacterium]
NQIVVPIVMKRATGLNPIITLAALIIGGNLGGILGMLLSIPVALFIETLLIEAAAERKNEAK